MVLKPQDVYVVLKIVASGLRAPYARLANELAMSPSEVHASVKRAQSAKLIHGPESRIVRTSRLWRSSWCTD
jgi:DNA-binding Lrp family transcriptional regulator